MAIAVITRRSIALVLATAALTSLLATTAGCSSKSAHATATRATTDPTPDGATSAEARNRFATYARDAAQLELKELIWRKDNNEPLTLAFTESYVTASHRVMRCETQLDPSRAKEFALDHFRRCRDFARATSLVEDPPINLATVRGISATAEAAQHALDLGALPAEVDMGPFEEVLQTSKMRTRDW